MPTRKRKQNRRVDPIEHGLIIDELPRNQWNWLRKFCRIKGLRTTEAIEFCIRVMQKFLKEVEVETEIGTKTVYKAYDDNYLQTRGVLMIREILRRVSSDDSDLDGETFLAADQQPYAQAIPPTPQAPKPTDSLDPQPYPGYEEDDSPAYQQYMKEQMARTDTVEGPIKPISAEEFAKNPAKKA